MRPEALTERIKAQPFIPFVLVTADGARFRIQHPEWLAFAGGRSAVVVEPDDRTHCVDVAQVVKLETDPPAPAGRSRVEAEGEG
jgi:hypothetical protein